jgi:alanine dehydrogenase
MRHLFRARRNRAAGFCYCFGVLLAGMSQESLMPGNTTFDVIVIGGGHAGTEACLAAAGGGGSHSLFL